PFDHALLATRRYGAGPRRDRFTRLDGDESAAGLVQMIRDDFSLVIGMHRAAAQFPAVHLVPESLRAFEHLLVAAQTHFDGLMRLTPPGRPDQNRIVALPLLCDLGKATKQARGC